MAAYHDTTIATDDLLTAPYNMLLPPLPSPTESSSRRVQQRQRYRSRRGVAVANSIISGLNDLSVSLNKRDTLHSHCPSYVHPEHFATARQPLQPSTIRRCHTRVYEAALRFSRDSPTTNVVRSGGRATAAPINDSIDVVSLLDDLNKYDPQLLERGYYSESCPARVIRADLLSLPEVGSARTVKLLDILPPHLAAIYSTPMSPLLMQPHDTVKVVKRRAFMCSREEYVKVVRLLMARDMVSFTQSPVVENGLFAVDKDGGSAQRLIIDARPANSLFIKCPHVQLPTPDIMSQFVVPMAMTLEAAKADLDNFYHRIEMPQWMWPFMALPGLRAADVGLTAADGYSSDAIVYPCLKTLAMGFSHAVYLAQACHEHIIDTRVPLLRRADRLTRRGSHGNDGVGDPFRISELPPPSDDYRIDRVRHSVYIDDINIYGPNAAAVNAALDQYVSAMTVIGLPPKPSKTRRATSNGLEGLGIVVDGQRGQVGLSLAKLHALCAATVTLLNGNKCSSREMARMVGRWNWAMMVRRPAMSVFSAVYRFIQCAHSNRFDIWPSVRRELSVAVRIAPLLYADIKSDWAPVVVASDASSTGSGVTFVDLPSSPATSTALESLARVRCVPGEAASTELKSFVEGSRWKTAVSHHWRGPEEHINSLEMRAALTSVRWMVKRPCVLQPDSLQHRRVLLLTDSSTAYGALSKGRSSAYSILRSCRSIAALSLAAGLYLNLKWVPSALNPADGPSRVTHLRSRVTA
jgi:hypothetical protein